MTPRTAIFADSLRAAIERIDAALAELGYASSGTTFARDLRRIRSRMQAALDVVEGRSAA